MSNQTDIHDPSQAHAAGREFAAKDRKDQLVSSVREAGSRVGLAAPPSDDSRQKLNEQEQLTLNAIRSASDLQRQLTATQAELATMQARWLNLQKESLGRKASAEDLAELASSKSKLMLLEKDFARERQGRQVDGERSAAAISQLERDIQAATGAILEATRLGKRDHKIWLSVATGAIGLVVVLTGLLIYRSWPLFGGPRTGGVKTEQPANVQEPEQTASIAHAGGSLARRPIAPYVSSASQPKLTRALGRLTHALSGFRATTSQDVLREVSRRQSKPDSPVCSFEWNNGEPAIQPTGKPGAVLDGMAETLTRCAEAVEQFR